MPDSTAIPVHSPSMPHSDDRRPVITGTGLWCPAGPSVEAAWSSIVQGESSVIDCDGELKKRWPGRYFMAGRPVGASGPHHLAVREAIRQSSLFSEETGSDGPGVPDDVGFVFGASKGRLAYTNEWAEDSLEGLVADHPLYPWPPSSMGNDLREHLPICGPATCPIAACASGLVSLIQAARWIEWRQCDSVIAGSADYSLTQSVLSAYRRLGVLSNWKGEAAGACRPFDRERSGFVIGEGAGLLIVEDESRAIARGARPLAIISGYDHRTDPTGLVESDADGDVIAVVIANAIADAGIETAEISAICCHGTGTIANDRAEAVALRTVFGRQLDSVPCFSLKGAIGHTLGASGAVETVVCVRALEEQIVPPHLNAENVDRDCPIGPLANEPLTRPIQHILKLSYGFGGHVAAVVLTHVS